MARASGLALVGGPEGNDPMAASTHGTGELHRGRARGRSEPHHRRRRWLGDDRRRAWARCGRSSRRRGFGASRWWWPATCGRRSSMPRHVFGPQKGATPAQVELLRRRLERLAQVYLEDYGVDVRRSRAAARRAGWRAGWRRSARSLVSGFELVANEIELADPIEERGSRRHRRGVRRRAVVRGQGRRWRRRPRGLLRCARARRRRGGVRRL